jgi:hypothetical protein
MIQAPEWEWRLAETMTCMNDWEARAMWALAWVSGLLIGQYVGARLERRRRSR